MSKKLTGIWKKQGSPVHGGNCFNWWFWPADDVHYCIEKIDDVDWVLYKVVRQANGEWSQELASTCSSLHSLKESAEHDFEKEQLLVKANAFLEMKQKAKENRSYYIEQSGFAKVKRKFEFIVPEGGSIDSFSDDDIEEIATTQGIDWEIAESAAAVSDLETTIKQRNDESEDDEQWEYLHCPSIDVEMIETNKKGM